MSTYYFGCVYWILSCFDCRSIYPPKSKRKQQQKKGRNTYPEDALFEGESKIELRTFDPRSKTRVSECITRFGHDGETTLELKKDEEIENVSLYFTGRCLEFVQAPWKSDPRENWHEDGAIY